MATYVVVFSHLNVLHRNNGSFVSGIRWAWVSMECAKILESAHYADYDRESLDAMLDLCQTVAEDQFLSCAAKLDANEPIFVDGKVETIPELK